MPPYELADFLEESFQLLHDHVPSHHEHVCHLLGRQRVRVAVGSSVCIVSAAGGDAPELAECDVRVGVRRRDLLDVLDGYASLEAAIHDGRLEILGDIQDILRFHDSLLAYVNAIVQIPHSHFLLDRYRRSAEPTVSGGPRCLNPAMVTHRS